MASPYNKLRSKLSRAIVAYLIQAGCGTVADVFQNESTAARAYPNTTAKCGISKPENNFTGNRRVNVYVSVKGSATLPDGTDDEDAARALFDERVSLTYDALLQTDDEQTLKFTAAAITAAGRALATAGTPQQQEDNADMADFTCSDWYESGEGDGLADADGCSWEAVLMFEAVACPSALG